MISPSLPATMDDNTLHAIAGYSREPLLLFSVHCYYNLALYYHRRRLRPRKKLEIPKLFLGHFLSTKSSLLPTPSLLSYRRLQKTGDERDKEKPVSINFNPAGHNAPRNPLIPLPPDPANLPKRGHPAVLDLHSFPNINI